MKGSFTPWILIYAPFQQEAAESSLSLKNEEWWKVRLVWRPNSYCVVAKWRLAMSTLKHSSSCPRPALLTSLCSCCLRKCLPVVSHNLRSNSQSLWGWVSGKDLLLIPSLGDSPLYWGTVLLGVCFYRCRNLMWLFILLLWHRYVSQLTSNISL